MKQIVGNIVGMQPQIQRDRVVITVAPMKGRTTKWNVKCSACSALKPQINKIEGEKCASDHAYEVHQRAAIIRITK